MSERRLWKVRRDLFERAAILGAVGDDQFVALAGERSPCLVVGYVGPVDEDCRRIEAFCRERSLPFMPFETFKGLKGKNLKTTRIGKNWTGPGHKTVQPSHLGDQIRAWS